MKFEIDPNELTTDQRAHVAAFITGWPAYSEVANRLKEILDAPETEEFKMAKRAGGIAGARNLSEEQRLDAEQKSDLGPIGDAVDIPEANLDAIFGTPTTQDQWVSPMQVAAEVAASVPLDKEGLPWDSRIHASTKTFISDGSWKLRRGVDPAEVEKVKTQLRELMAAPVAGRVYAGTLPIPPEDVDEFKEEIKEYLGPVPVPTVTSHVPVPTPPSVELDLTNRVSLPQMPVPKSHYLVDIPVPGIDLSIPSTVTLTDLIARMSSAIVAGKMTQATVTEMCAKHGVSEFMLLSSRPDLLPLIDADMKALGV